MVTKVVVQVELISLVSPTLKLSKVLLPSVERYRWGYCWRMSWKDWPETNGFHLRVMELVA